MVFSFQNSQNLANTIRQIESRTWCWLMYGYVKYILCAAGAPSASRAYGDSHTWKNECGVVVCVSRICLLGAKAPPPYSFLSAGVHRTVARLLCTWLVTPRVHWQSLGPHHRYEKRVCFQYAPKPRDVARPLRIA